MLALALLAATLPILWLGQSLLLLAARRPLRWRISTQDAPPPVRNGSRIITQLAIVAIIIAYPLLRDPAGLRGRSLTVVRDYYAGLLPPGRPILAALDGFLMALLFLALLYLAWALAGNVRFALRHQPRRLLRKLLPVPLSALLGATVEELLFRAILLADLLRTLPRTPAILIGASVFACAHYVREVKRRWTFPGHVALGVLLCLAFVWTGSLWLSIGLHAGGIFAIMAARPFVRYEGPAWLTGASIFPFAGAVGVLGLGLLAAAVGIIYHAS